MVASSHVLVVDDSAVARAAVAGRLRRAGLVVLEAESVAGAKALANASYAVALLDFELPDGTGVTIAEHLRSLRPTLPIGFFTSLDADARASAERIGRCFRKPDELDAAVAWVLENV